MTSAELREEIDAALEEVRPERVSHLCYVPTMRNLVETVRHEYVWLTYHLANPTENTNVEERLGRLRASLAVCARPCSAIRRPRSRGNTRPRSLASSSRWRARCATAPRDQRLRSDQPSSRAMSADGEPGPVSLTPADLDAIRTVIREKLRRCGLRPPAPAAFGHWRWDGGRDAWVTPSDDPAPTPAPAAAG